MNKERKNLEVKKRNFLILILFFLIAFSFIIILSSEFVDAAAPDRILYRCYTYNLGYNEYFMTSDPNCEKRDASTPHGSDGPFVKIYSTQESGTFPLYSCSAPDHFEDITGSCGAIIGYVRTTPAPNFNSVYRCWDGRDHKESLSSSCEGSNNEGVLYYAVPPDFVPPAISVSTTASASSGTAPLSVTFTSAVSGGSGSYSSYSWSFSDGTTASGASVSKTFSSAGTYTATLTVTDSFGTTATSSKTVTMNSPSQLSASIIAIPSSGTAPLTTQFTSTVSGGTGSYTYSWNYGDGTTGSEANPSHVYTTQGSYTATMTVTSGPKTAVKTQTITVLAALPQNPDTNETVCNTQVGKGSGKNVFLANAPSGKKCCGINGKQDAGTLTSDKANACIFNNRTCGTRKGLCWKQAISENFGDVELVRTPGVNIPPSFQSAVTLPQGLVVGFKGVNRGTRTSISENPYTTVYEQDPESNCPSEFRRTHWCMISWNDDSICDAVYTCTLKNQITKAVIPKGVLCGFSFVNTNANTPSITGREIACQTSTPTNGCPSGYSRATWNMVSWNGQASANSVLTCVSQSETTEVPNGAWCGISWKNVGPIAVMPGESELQGSVPCQGNNPEASCPQGYTKEQFSMLAWGPGTQDPTADFITTCVKT